MDLTKILERFLKQINQPDGLASYRGDGNLSSVIIRFAP